MKVADPVIGTRRHGMWAGQIFGAWREGDAVCGTNTNVMRTCSEGVTCHAAAVAGLERP
jgi:hypothetical protein